MTVLLLVGITVALAVIVAAIAAPRTLPPRPPAPDYRINWTTYDTFQQDRRLWQ